MLVKRTGSRRVAWRPALVSPLVSIPRVTCYIPNSPVSSGSRGGSSSGSRRHQAGVGEAATVDRAGPGNTR